MQLSMQPQAAAEMLTAQLAAEQAVSGSDDLPSAHHVCNYLTFAAHSTSHINQPVLLVCFVYFCRSWQATAHSPWQCIVAHFDHALHACIALLCWGV